VQEGALTACLLFLLFFAGANTLVHDKAVIAKCCNFSFSNVLGGNLFRFLGERMLADNFLGKSVAVREVMPQDLKLDMDQMTREQCRQDVTWSQWLETCMCGR
jgi:hypothetical protein